METNEIIHRLERIAPYGTHYPGEPLFVLSLDDGIALKEAIELLKEQEPVEPINENYWKHTMGRCGNCKAPLPALEGLRSKFCWMCGRAVKWN